MIFSRICYSHATRGAERKPPIDNALRIHKAHFGARW